MSRPDGRGDASPYSDTPRPHGGGGHQPGPAGKPDRGGRIALLLAVPGIVLSVFFFPVGLVLDAGAVVIGVRALRRARRRRTQETGAPQPTRQAGAPGAIAGIVIGSTGLLVVAVVVTVFALFYQEVRSYQECMSGANTIRSQQKCLNQFENAIRERFGVNA